jgi:hypothetical protein
MKMMKKCGGVFIALLAMATQLSCKKDKSKETRFDDDGWTEERASITALDNDLSKLGTGAFKALLDTNSLLPKEKYIVVFKPTYQEPLALHYSGNDDDKDEKAQLAARNIMTKAKADFADDVVEDTATLEWHSTFFCGFTGTLNPHQVKELYKDDRVDYIARDLEYETYGAPTYASGTKPLFVHGHKQPSATTKKIWILDTGGDVNSPFLNIDLPYCKSFVANGLSTNADHGNMVAHVAASSEYAVNNCRGTAEGARIVLLKAGDGGTMNWTAVNKALEYCWIYSKRGDIVNISFGHKAFDLTQTMAAAIAQMEANILKFKDWDMPVVMAAGNHGDYASRYSPCRLGLKYKDAHISYKFLHVVANIRATGSEAEIKSGGTKFELNNDLEKNSNFGRAVRWGVMGTWQGVKVGGSTILVAGTSYSAPALCGILYHNSTPLAEPELTVHGLNYKKGDTYYAHLVPKI